MLIDTHTHVNFKEFEGEVDETIRRSLNGDIWMVNVGTQYATSKTAIDLAERYDDGVFASIGIHPIHLMSDITESAVIEGHEYSFTTKKQIFDYERFKELATSSSKVVGIGETGLDIYRLGGLKKEEVLEVQESIFRQHINLAKELDLALIIHGRGEADHPYDIYDRIIDILEEENVSRAVMHCFGGNLEQAQRIVNLGYNIGVTGIVTFKNATMVHNIVKVIPLNSIVIETDAPYLSPEPYRGKRNEPSYVQHVASKIANFRGCSFDEVANETTINARRLYII